MAHDGPGIAFDNAFIRGPLPENEREQGRFPPVTIGAHQGDMVAVIDIERRVLEEHAPAQGHFKITNYKHENESSPTICRHEPKRFGITSTEAEALFITVATS